MQLIGAQETKMKENLIKKIIQKNNFTELSTMPLKFPV